MAMGESRVSAESVDRARFEDAKRVTHQLYSVVEERDATEIAERLRSATARISGCAVIAVVGERSRGKSRLVNELLEREALLPVEVDVTTNSYIEVRGRPSPLPENERAIVRFAEAEAEEQAVELGRLGEFVSETGNPGNRKGVSFVEVRCISPLLETGLRLLDTPGVGGLLSAHGNVTLRALRRADAVLVVLSSSEPVTDAELEFLARAAGDARRVVIALSKAEDPKQIAAIADYDREAIATRIPRFAAAPIVPVSALFAAEARCERESDPDYAARLEADSGIARLRDGLLAGVLDPALRTQADGLLAEASACLAELARPGRELVAALEGPGDPTARARTVREEIRTLRAKRPTVEFDQATNPIRRELDARLRAQLAEARDELSDEVELEWRTELEQEIPERLRVRLTEVWGAICNELEDEMAAAAIAVAEEIGAVLERTELEGGEGHSRLAEAMAQGMRDPAEHGMTQERLLMMGTRGLTPLTIGIFAWNPISIAAGVGIMVVSEVLQRRLARRREVQKFVDRTVRRATSELTRALDSRARELRDELTKQLEAPRTTRIASLEASRALLESGPEHLAAAQRTLARLGPIEDRIGELIDAGAERWLDETVAEGEGEGD